MPVDDVLRVLERRQSTLDDYLLYRDYYNGAHRIAFSTEVFERHFRDILANSRENLCPAVVKAHTDKLSIDGWDGPGAEQAEANWATHGLVRVQNLVHREAFRCGDAFALVWPDAKGQNRVWPKRADEMVPFTSPTDPLDLEMLGMVWVADDDRGRVNLYYDDRVERYVTLSRVRDQSANAVQWPLKVTAWRPADASYDGEPEVIRHAFGEVPGVWWTYDADMLGGYGRSVLTDVVPLQDALNKSLADLIVGGEAYVFPLRYGLNIAPGPIDPKTGKPTPPTIKVDPTKNRFLAFPGNGPVGQLDPPDATKLIAVQDAYALKIARVKGIPPYYLTMTSGDVPSGTSLRVLTSRLSAAIEDAQQDLTPGWTRLQRLLGVSSDTAPQWEDPAPMDRMEELDAARTEREIGYPFTRVAKHLGEDAEDLAEIEAERAAEENVGEQAVNAFNAGQDPAEFLRGRQ